MLVPLRSLINSAAGSREDSSRVAVWLSSFSCAHDSDIEDYLHNRAVRFEALGKSRTYLVCDQEIMRTEGRLQIFGFFTVALKVLDLPEQLSNRKRLELDGFSAKMRGEVIRSVPCYLIGQLAKNSALPGVVSGAELLKYALQMIASAAQYVGGRYVLIECHDDLHLRKFYTDNDFAEFDMIPDAGMPMVQMIRPI